MARRYRSVFPGHPHHVIQRGNRRQQVFFEDGDYRFYLQLLRRHCDRYGVRLLAYCLMTNHVHLVLEPSTWESLAKTVAETHKIYTKAINKRNLWRGYLWQGRFSSFILHEAYFWTVMRYVELNPVRAGMVTKADRYEWSSARAHMGGGHNSVLDKVELLPGWSDILNENITEDELQQIRLHSSTGRPLGDGSFLDMIKKELGVDWALKKRGPKTSRQKVEKVGI